MRVEGLSANKITHFSVILEVGFQLPTLDKISVSPIFMSMQFSFSVLICLE